MCWASFRPTDWMRSVVPIVWSTHGEVAAQSPARGWAPPTTTTDLATGSRSPGRCPSGACASNAAASAMPQTVAPDLSAPDLRVAAAFGGRLMERVAPSLQLPVFAPEGADAHALEALGDRVAEEAERLQALREEVAVDHRRAPGGVVLVDDLEQRLLERADAVRLGARVTALPVVRRALDASPPDRPAEARRAHAQARRRANALVHRHAPGVRARGLGERRMGVE